jgi:methylglutaconyl-CoA hydratase
MDMNKPLDLKIKDRIATITLNRPEKRNALNDEMVAHITNAFAEVQVSDGVKVVMLSHTGEVFCSGADLAHLQQMQGYDFEQNKADSEKLKDMFVQIFSCSKPVVGVVNGNAFAGGAGLLAVCDFVFCNPESRFYFTEVKIGFIPAIVSYFTIKKTGKGRAAEWLLSGRAITPDEALQVGYISHISDKDKIYDEAFAFAQKLALQCSGEAMAQTKRLIQKLFYNDMQAALELTVEANAQARESADCKRGISAFLSKEKITW